MNHTWESYTFDQGFKYGEKRSVDILIGAPIQKRDWIIDEWFKHVWNACKVADLNPAFIFVMDPTEEPLRTMIYNASSLLSSDLHIGAIVEEERDDKRVWDQFRYEKMVSLRNVLLEGVRQVAPPLFLSLDSDILLHQDAIKSMVDKMGDADAIGGKTYMTHTGTEYPSYGMINTYNNMIRREDQWGCFKVDVLMAIKLMRPPAYGQDYKYDTQGEDIGWSKNCYEAGLKLVWDGSVANKHVMRPEDKDRVDVRCGF